jgi:hypothetical protein
MRKFTALLAIFISVNAFAGGSGNPPAINLHLKKPADIDRESFLTENKEGRGLSFGYNQFASANLNAWLRTNSSAAGTFADNYLTVGLDNFQNNGKHYDGISSLGFIIPQKVNAGIGDSLTLRLTGWHLTTSAFGYDVIKGEVVTLAIGPAFAWGNLKMRRDVNGAKTKYTNPFVAPGGRAEIRFDIANFIIGGRVTYRYDITNTLWKRKNDMMPVLPEYGNSGLAFFGYIGIMIGKDEESDSRDNSATPPAPRD